MNALTFGLLVWLAVAILASLLIGRFLRGPQPEDDTAPQSADACQIPGLPGYGCDEASAQPSEDSRQ